MNQRGRKSAAALAVIHGEIRRLEPTVDLPAEQREIWLRVINSKPADWFGEEHRDMLRSYCRHVAYGNMIGRALDTVQSEWLADPQRLDDYETMFQMHEHQTRAAAQWATRMRLTQQAIDKKIAARRSLSYEPGAKPWQSAANG